MRVLFAGTPGFAARCLAQLIQSQHKVECVVTQPDRPAGRGLAQTASEVKALATERGIQVLQPVTLKDPSIQEQLKRLGADAIVTAAYGLLLPKEVLEITPGRAINVHASLLPRWRGAAPVQWTLLAGDEVTGVSIMQMDAGLDTGPVLLQEKIHVTDSDTAGALTDRLAALGGKLLVRALDALEAGELRAVPQPPEGATYAPKPDKREFRLDWRQEATMLERRVRAFNPSPGASARVRGVELKIWACTLFTGSGYPGEVLSADKRGLCVACGEGALMVTELQRTGGRRLLAPDFLRGFALSAGERFEA